MFQEEKFAFDLIAIHNLLRMSSNDSYLPNITTNYSRLDCPVFTEQEHYLINQFNVWIEGVTQTCVAIPGFLGKLNQYRHYLAMFEMQYRYWT